MYAIFKVLPPYPAPLPLANEAWPVLTIIAVYLIFVLKVGRIYMQNRPPFDLKTALSIYNLFQVAYNGIFFLVMFYNLIMHPVYDPRCMETYPLGHPHKDLERHLHFAFYINKIIDLLDTVFFLLRKSYKQITFLHVYHHVMMITCTYMILKYYGSGGQFASVAMINAFVHTVMYFYYFQSTRNPDVSISWKKYITLIQLMQFVIVFVHATYVLLISKNCGFPKSLLWLQIVQSTAMMYMFGKFYIKTYIRAKKHQKRG